MPQDRLRKFTDENKELAVNLKKEASDSTRDRAGGSNGAPGISGGGGVGGVGGPLQKKKQQQQRVSGMKGLKERG